MKNALCCYFPTTVAFVDDDSNFLEHVKENLMQPGAPVKAFQEPHVLLDFLAQDRYREDFLKRIISYGDDMQQYGEETLSLYFIEILKEIYNKERYNQTSVVVVDYDMPSMKGIEVCQRIQNPHVKKILLTGVADETLAIQAFNEGLIYQYIRKHDPDCPAKLQAAIETAQREYFHTLFQTMMKAFEHRYYSTALLDPVFVDYFEKLLVQNNIREYYLVEPMGTYFMIDEDNNHKCLFTMVEDMLETFVPEEPTPSMEAATLKKIQDRKLIFCLHDPSEDFFFDTETYENWDPYLKKPSILKGANDTYYTYFGDNLIPLAEREIQLYKGSR